MLEGKQSGEGGLSTRYVDNCLFWIFLLWTYHLLTACDTLILALEEKMNHLPLFIFSFSLTIGQISVKAFPQLSLFRLNSPDLFMNSFDCRSIFFIILGAFLWTSSSVTSFFRFWDNSFLHWYDYVFCSLFYSLLIIPNIQFTFLTTAEHWADIFMEIFIINLRSHSWMITVNTEHLTKEERIL